jgi:uncharacterized protein
MKCVMGGNEMQVFLADSYAIVEYFKGNVNYKKYFEKNKIITTKLNLMEVYYSALVNSTKENANKYYDSLVSECILVSDQVVKDALQFRYENRKQRLAYIGAIGYQLSLELGVKFLTGDKEFEKMKNVEFVK